MPKPERPSKLQGGSIVAPPSERVDLREWGGLLPGEVVLLTFTNRAADEMRDRLRRSIARLQPGPTGDDGTRRSDPRIRHKGFGEQLLTLLEDAPIGTIDSFLNQLVSPYRGILGDALSRENVSDAGRVLLVGSALNTLWRLPSSLSHIGEAVDAGIPSGIAPEVLAARDRIARHYSGRRSAARVLRSLVGNSVFIEEAARRIMDGDGISPELLHQQIMASVDAEEVARVVPVIEALADEPEVASGAVRISVDTRHGSVARAAVAVGADIVNDVSAGLGDVAADLGVGWVAMHMQGDPRTMQDEPAYDNVVAEVRGFLVDRAERATAAGVPEVWIDPGIGFGKTIGHNLALLARLDVLVSTGWPVVLGVSRKRFLGELTRRSDQRGGDETTEPTSVYDRREASVAMAAWAFLQGVRVVRAHDVRATVQASKVVG